MSLELNRIQLKCVNEKKQKITCIMTNTRSNAIFNKNSTYDIMIQRFIINNKAIPLFIPTIKEPFYNIFKSDTITPQQNTSYSEKMSHYINGVLVKNVFTQPFQIMIKCNGNTYGSYVPYIPNNGNIVQPTCKYNTAEFFSEKYFHCHSPLAFVKMLTQTLENIIQCSNGTLEFLETSRFAIIDGSLISLVLPESAYAPNVDFKIYFNHDLNRMLGFITNEENEGLYELEVLQNETITQRIVANTFIINDGKPMGVITEHYSSSHLFPWSKMIFTTPMPVNALMTYSNALGSMEFSNNTIAILTDYVFTSVNIMSFYDMMIYSPVYDNRKVRLKTGDHDIKSIYISVLLETHSGISIPMLLNPEDSGEILMQIEEL